MRKYRSFILLLVMSALLFAPFKLPTCPKQILSAPVVASMAAPCSPLQVANSSCFSASYWLLDEYLQSETLVLQSLLGLLSFLVLFSKYHSPLEEIYHPPI